jgi:1-acyl-sn-glycerol-3-phosphate acyltransferase
MVVMNGAERPRGSRWRGLMFNAAFYAWTTLLLPIGAIVGLASPAGARAMSRFWARSVLSMLTVLTGLRYRVVGTVPREPVMFAVKHQSAWETVALSLIVHDPVFVLKQELARIPVFGWLLLRTGNIAVDRTGGGAALRSLLAAAQQRIGEGRPIVIFPEGTRTAPGTRHPYHPGVAALYGALDVPVVPVALNSGLFWPRRSLALAPGEITLEFLPAIPPGLPRRAFMAQLEGAIEGAAYRLAGAAHDIR